MNSPETTREESQRLHRVHQQLRARGQEHVLRWWDELSGKKRAELLNDLESLDWQLLDPLIQTHVLSTPARDIPGELSPPKVFPSRPKPGDELRYEEAGRLGRQLLLQGKVAALTVAGGQGTRLGIDGPKGAVAVTPVGNRTLFELFAGMVLAARRRYGSNIPWYIMTSQANHVETVRFFEQHRFFDLPREDVSFFVQGMLPAFDFQGRLLLESKHRLAMAPDGHGGSLKALLAGSSLADMRNRGIQIISYFQVDNPLVKPFDPPFIGLHALTRSEMSTKVTPKADDLERVGNVCVADGKLRVIEYSELPDELARARNSDGSRRFDSGNLAIHLLAVDFVDRIVGRSFQLPFRRAEKVVPFMDDGGKEVHPEKPNAVKLETFIFDALPLANNPLVFEVERAEEFSPVKNATGRDSLDTSKRDQVLRACRWLESAGLRVPRKSDGTPDVTVVISPLFALDADELKKKADRIPPLKPGDALYLE